MTIDSSQFTTVTVLLTRDNLPEGLVWEKDGACWRAAPCTKHPVSGEDWRWQPMNLKAFVKDGPEGVMLDTYWPAE